MSELPADGPAAEETESLPDCPYRGLEPFTDAHQKYFFGRKPVQKTIAANLLTAGLTILYGPTGVGKTSVLQAGVVPAVRDRRGVTVVVFRNWQRPDFLQELNQTIADEVRQKTGRPFPVATAFDECVGRALRELHGSLAIIFDQFEEYLLYHPRRTDRGREFDAQLAAAINLDDDATFLIAVREDALASLDRFKASIPDLLSNYLRLDHLDSDGARDAILKPVEYYNEVAREHHRPDLIASIEPELVEELVRQAAVKRPVLSADTRPGVPVDSADRPVRVEPALLQMILVRLWKQASGQRGRPLRLSTLRDLRGADNIVQTHIEDVMGQLTADERAVCAVLFDRLVTPSATKIAFKLTDLTRFAEKRAALVPGVIEKLTDPEARVLRTVDPISGSDEKRYEIYHDVLCVAVQNWREAYLQNRKLEREEHRRRIVANVVAVGVLLIIGGAASVSSWQQRREKSRLLERLAIQGQLLDIQKERAKVEAQRRRDVAEIYEVARTTANVKLLVRSLDLYEQLGDEAGQMEALEALADAERAGGVTNDVFTHYNAALVLARKLQRGEVEARLLEKLALSYAAQSHTERARMLFAEALAKRRALNDQAAVAAALVSIGDFHRTQSAYQPAMDAYAEAKQFYAAANDRRREADVLEREAIVAQSANKSDDALKLFRQALAIQKQVGDAAGQARTLVAINGIRQARNPQLQSISNLKVGPCQLSNLAGEWRQVTKQIASDSFVTWNFEVRGTAAEALLHIARTDKLAEGDFAVQGTYLKGALHWANGEEWSDVQLSPAEGEQCGTLSTNQTWTFVRTSSP